MLAPLKDRTILEREPAEATLQAENAALKLSLRQARQAQKRTATLTARQIVGLTNEINHLNEVNRLLQARLAELESGQAVIVLGQQLMALRQENDDLTEAAQRLWYLDRTLCAAHRECERLACERDAALAGLQACSAGRLMN